MSFGNGLGVDINIEENQVFTKNIGSLIIETNESIDHHLLKEIGKVIGGNQLIINGNSFDIEDLRQAYTSTFESLFSNDGKRKNRS